jgi:hypothetical protein
MAVMKLHHFKINLDLETTVSYFVGRCSTTRLSLDQTKRRQMIFHMATGEGRSPWESGGWLSLLIQDSLNCSLKSTVLMSLEHFVKGAKNAIKTRSLFRFFTRKQMRWPHPTTNFKLCHGEIESKTKLPISNLFSAGSDVWLSALESRRIHCFVFYSTLMSGWIVHYILLI